MKIFFTYNETVEEEEEEEKNIFRRKFENQILMK